MAFVCMLHLGRNRDPVMAACAINIWLWSTNYDLYFPFLYITDKRIVIGDLSLLLLKRDYTAEKVLKLNKLVPYSQWLIYLFIWGFTSLSTLYRSYHDG